MKTTFQKWIFASKIMSWPKLMVAYILGTSMGIHKNPEFSFVWVCLGLLFTTMLLLYIVFLNDYADREIDTLKRKMFPEESPKTIPDGILPAGSLLYAGMVFFVLGNVINLYAGYLLFSWFIVAIGAGCFVFFFVYSFPPIRLNYRGGGEVLEGFGVGLVLPFYSYFLITHDYSDFTYAPIYAFYVLLSLSSALASGLSDEESDRAGGKVTFVTEFGNSKTRMFIFILIALSLVILAFFPFFYDLVGHWWVGVIFLYLLYFINRMNQVSHKATTNQFLAQKTFKKYLHNGIWGSILILSAGLVFSAF